MAGTAATTVIEVSGVQWASSKSVAEAVLSRGPGVLAVNSNPVSQTATITYDVDRTSVAELTGWVRACGYHCAGRSVPAVRPDGRTRSASSRADQQPRRG